MFVTSVLTSGGGAFGGLAGGDRFCTRVARANGTAAMKAALASNSVGYRAVLGQRDTEPLSTRFAEQWSTCVARPDGTVCCTIRALLVREC
jgi:hypothetical protein